MRTTAPEKYRVKPSNSSCDPGASVDIIVSPHGGELLQGGHSRCGGVGLGARAALLKLTRIKIGFQKSKTSIVSTYFFFKVVSFPSFSSVSFSVVE